MLKFKQGMLTWKQDISWALSLNKDPQATKEREE